jgi:hypothetical protein
MINPRAIALRGITSGVKSIALRGLFYIVTEVTPSIMGRRIPAKMPRMYQMRAPRWQTR